MVTQSNAYVKKKKKSTVPDVLFKVLGFYPLGTNIHMQIHSYVYRKSLWGTNIKLEPRYTSTQPGNSSTTKLRACQQLPWDQKMYAVCLEKCVLLSLSFYRNQYSIFRKEGLLEKNVYVRCLTNENKMKGSNKSTLSCVMETFPQQ